MSDETSNTWLNELRNAKSSAPGWQRLLKTYGPFVERILAGQGIERNTADDVVQNVISGQKVDGIALSFQIDLTDGICHSTCPRIAAQENSWLTPLYLFSKQLVPAGDEFVKIGYRYGQSDSEDGLFLL